MESPNKKKLRSGVQSTVGGKLGGNTYKTASPYSMRNTPLKAFANNGGVKKSVKQ